MGDVVSIHEKTTPCKTAVAPCKGLTLTSCPGWRRSKCSSESYVRQLAFVKMETSSAETLPFGSEAGH